MPPTVQTFDVVCRVRPLGPLGFEVKVRFPTVRRLGSFGSKVKFKFPVDDLLGETEPFASQITR